MKNGAFLFRPTHFSQHPTSFIDAIFLNGFYTLGRADRLCILRGIKTKMRFANRLLCSKLELWLFHAPPSQYTGV